MSHQPTPTVAAASTVGPTRTVRPAGWAVLVLLAALVVSAAPLAPVAAQDGAPLPLDRAVLVVDHGVAELPGEPRLVVVEPDGTRRRLVPGGSRLGRWSPDGALIAHEPAGASGISVVRGDGGGRRVVAVDRDLPLQPWSPEGTEVLAIEGSTRLEAVAVDSDAAREVFTADGGEIANAAWSPGEARIAVTTGGGGAATHDLWSVLARGGQPGLLDRDVASPPAWSPDGSALAYLVRPDADGADDLAVLDLVRAERHVIPDVTDTGDHDHPPVWSPDGATVAVLDQGAVVLTDPAAEQARRVDISDTVPAATRVVGWTDPAGPLVVDAAGSRLVQIGADGSVTVRLDALPSELVEIAPVPTTPVPPTVARALWWSRRRPDASAPTVLLGRADEFADSLASGGPQGTLGAPLLLTPTASLHPAVADELVRLAASRVLILGGTAAVSPAVEQALVDRGLDVQRLAGSTRLSTAVAVADATADAPTRVVVARAYGDPEDPTRGFADSLAAGALAAGLQVPLLLTDSAAASPELLEWLDRTESVQEVVLVGGEAALGDAVAEQLTAQVAAVTRIGGATRTETAAAVRAFGIEAAAGDDTPPPTGGLIALVQADDPLAWSDGFAVAGQADPTAGGGVLLADGSRPMSALPVPTLAGLLDAPTASTLACAPLHPAAACARADAARAAAAVEPTLRARATSGDLIADAVVRPGDAAVCVDARMEGSDLARVSLGYDDAITMPAPLDGRSIACVATADANQAAPQVGDEITFTTTDGAELTATFAAA